MKTLVDSSGWIEFFTDGPKANHYAAYLTPWYISFDNHLFGFDRDLLLRPASSRPAVADSQRVT